MGAAPNIPYPLQVPGYDLPGAEWFSLAPNRTIALQGRRRIVLSPPTTNAPATTNNVNNVSTLALETQFTQTSGIYIHRFWVTIGPSGPGLVIQNILAGLTLAAVPFADYPLGNPALTNPTIAIGTVVLTDRDLLVTAKDIAAAGLALGQTITQNLQLSVTLTVNNSTAGAITFNARTGIVYTRLDGFVE